MVHRHSSASFSSHGSCGPWPAVGLQAEWRLAFADDSSAGVTEHSLAVDFESHASPPGEAWPEASRRYCRRAGSARGGSRPPRLTVSRVVRGESGTGRSVTFDMRGDAFSNGRFS